MGRIVRENKAELLLTLIAIVAGVLAGMLVYGYYNDAEAVLGGTGNLSLTNNPHNLSASSAGVHAEVETQICIFCHTPHNAIMNATLINAPLWNHTLSTATYTLKARGLYNSGIGNVGIVNMLTTPGQPDGASKLCLSCHDGTVSVGSVAHGGPITMATDACLVNGAMKVDAACPKTIGTDLTQKHVVSIPMNDTLIANSAAVCSQGGVTKKLKYPWDSPNAQATGVLLRPTRAQYGSTYGVTYPHGSMPASKYKSGYYYGVQCSSCHDPHYWRETSNQELAGYKFLVVGFNPLCMSCHTACP